MSHFYGGLMVRGKSGGVTRTASKDGQLSAHVRGQTVGVQVYIAQDSTGQDVVEVYLTDGSGGSGKERFLGRFTAEDLEA